MKLKSPQLLAHLKRHGLAAIYLLAGNEPLQQMECADAVRALARKQGFSERAVLNVEGRFDWKILREQADSLSLFASRRIIELRMGDKSPGDAGAKELIRYTENLPADTVLLITAEKVTAATEKTKWYQALDKRGLIVSIYPVKAQQMPAWIQQRMRAQGLHASTEAVSLIAERAEGHLLAAAQEIEKLHLLHHQGEISVAQVLDAVADSARFQVFGWIDTVLSGDAARISRQLLRLRQEGFEIVLLASLLTREIRTMCQIAYALKAGQTQAAALAKHRVWGSRKALAASAVRRHKLRTWQAFLRQAGQLDRIIKGAAPGNAWDEIMRLAMQVAGVNLGFLIKNDNNSSKIHNILE
ncbi:MAG: DNA polymerase III subunit delta [Gammaproteobacteria bacterium]|nr:DNA polymerase III subunit delta [Gammaproteobacteria bacterium]